jgi:CheY-like chemotaxis protein
LVNDILDFSKIEAGKLELEEHPFELRACVEESLDLLAPAAAEKGLDLSYEIEPGVPVALIGDVTRLRQILINLIGNAVKFTAQGEVAVSVTMVPDSAEPRAQFAVRDTGIGIPRDKWDRLFKSFSQVDTSTTRQFGGTGLGLAISNRLVEFMGGRMWFESEVGKGSVFYFAVKASPLPQASPLAWEESHQNLAGKRILIVEDNQSNQRILRRWLDGLDMHPVGVGAGQDALDALASNDEFDAVILDHQIPDLDALSVAESIRKLPERLLLPILLLTSTRLRVTDQRAAAAGISVPVHKPIRPKQLLDALNQIFDRRRISPRKSSAASAFDGSLAARLPLRILVADDSRVNQMVAVKFLEKLGYRSEVASNGLEVIQALDRHDFDIVFLDVQMPELDGYGAARQIRRRWTDEIRPRLIAMTGNAMEGDRQRCLEAGMDDYISKPVRIADIKTALERWGSKSATPGSS